MRDSRAEGRKEGRKEGRAEGRKEGKAEGRKEGKELGTTQRNIELAIDFLKKMPSWTDQQISEWSQLEEKKVAQIRAAFAQGDVQAVQALTPLLFEGIAGLTTEEVRHLEKWLLQLWKMFQEG